MRGRDADTDEMAEGRRMEAESEESPRVGAERHMIREYLNIGLWRGAVGHWCRREAMHHGSWI